jgi:dTDP-4-amino-4,6-dideoxygalactose transaminase
VVLDDALRAKAVSGHFRHLGIAPGYPGPLPELPALRQAVAPTRWPGAALLTSNLVTVPTHRWVADNDVARLLVALTHP